MTLPRRHVATVVDASPARVRGRALSASERRAVLSARGAFSVSYKLTDLRASMRKGRIVVSGRVSYADGSPPPRVLLYTYQLRGTITDAAGKPVAGAVVVTRTLDRDYWTLSKPTDANGRYTSFFTASDETQDNPVAFSVQVASGDTSYSYPFGTSVQFSRLRSATLDLQLPASGASLGTKPATPTAYRGGIYHGLLVGVTSGVQPVRPLYARWPDTHGNFELVLPRSFRGKTVSFFEQTRQVFSRATARANGPVDLGTWPGSLPGYVPQDLQSLRLPR